MAFTNHTYYEPVPLSRLLSWLPQREQAAKTTAAIDRARAYLATCPPAVSGHGGHGALFTAAAHAGPGFDLSPDQLRAILLSDYNPRCQPPWSDREIEHKVASVYKAFAGRTGWHLVDRPMPQVSLRIAGKVFTYGHAQVANGKPVAAATTAPEPKPAKAAVEFPRYQPTDLGNARRLVAVHGKAIRYCHPWKTWHLWDGRRWEADRAGKILLLTQIAIGEQLGVEISEAQGGARTTLEKWKIESEGRRRLENAAFLAASQPGVPVLPEELDQDPWLLNCANGILDLSTGKLAPHDPAKLMTKLSPVPYHESAEAPRWERFCLEVMAGRFDLVEYLARIAGYALTGVIREHAMFFLYGEGRNGKSLWLKTLAKIWGEYAQTINPAILTVNLREEHPTALADLHGCRLALSIELEDGKRLAESLVKSATGGDTLKARRLYQDFFQFTPTHHLFLAANHKPTIRGRDRGIWSRIHVVPFEVAFGEIDNPPTQRLAELDLEAQLDAELPGILAWCATGCRLWSKLGLADPLAVQTATEAYREEQDQVADFLRECCVVDEAATVAAKALYQAYQAWAKDSGVFPLSKKKLGMELEKKGFPVQHSREGDLRVGLGLIEAGGLF